jgi:protein-tyrosine phosphatase
MTSPAAVGFVNARDVGGLIGESGCRTKHGVLYRSEIPLHGDQAPQLDPWPPATVCDLRSAGERRGRHPLDTPATTVLVTPLVADADPAKLAANFDPTKLVDVYETILVTCGDKLARIAKAVVASPGATLIHCAGGKDRTGVAIAVLLSAVGVCRAEIIEDFLIPPTRVRLIHDRLVAAEHPRRREIVRRQLHTSDPWLLDAPAHAIEVLLDRLESHDDGAAGWLMSWGLDEVDISALRARLVETSA